MNRIILCNRLFIKRGFKKISFVILLLMMPLLCLLLKTSIKESKITIRAGIYLEDKGSIPVKICDNLTQNYESVSFEKCDSLQELKDKVASGYYECGYVFAADFTDKISTNNLKKIVDLYKSPGTLTSAMMNEYVFSEIFVEYGFNKLIDFIGAQKIFEITDTKSLRENLRPKYDYYLNSNDTFSFEYINADNEKIDNSGLLSSYVLLSVRGVISLFIMFAAFIGTFNLYKDSKTGIFIVFKSLSKSFCKMSEIFSITFLSILSGLFTIYLCDLSEGFLKECIRLLLYAIICTIYCFILYKIISNMYLFAALIPVFTIGSVIFCPIFIDISELIPVAKYVAWIFLPKYYFL